MQQLEQEVKLEVEPEWSLPDLTGLFPGVAAVALPVLSLDAVYYDTADTRLARHHITLLVQKRADSRGDEPCGSGHKNFMRQGMGMSFRHGRDRER